MDRHSSQPILGRPLQLEHAAFAILYTGSYIFCPSILRNPPNMKLMWLYVPTLNTEQDYFAGLVKPFF